MSPTAGAGDELVDVLGDDWEPIGTATRAEMRRRRLRHRSTYVLVFDSTGRLLIHKRADDKDVFPGYWDIAAGGVMVTGEEPASAARRELAEELGVATAITAMGTARHSGEIPVEGWLFLTICDGPFTFSDAEVVASEWIEPDRLHILQETRQFCPDSLEMFADFLGLA